MSAEDHRAEMEAIHAEVKKLTAGKSVAVNADWVNRDDQQLRLQVLDRLARFGQLMDTPSEVVPAAEALYKWVTGD